MFDILRYLLVFVEVVCSALLLGVILIQKTRSQGMGLAFGAGMGESLFGAQMGNVLTRATVILAIVFLSNTIVLAWMGARVGRRASVTEVVEAEPLPGGQPGMPPPGGTPAPVPDVPAVPVTDMPSVPAPIIEGQPGMVESVPVAPEPSPPVAPDAVTPPVDVAPAPVPVVPAPESAPAPVDPAPAPAPAPAPTP